MVVGFMTTYAISQDHYGFPSFPVVDGFCLFIYLWVLTFPLEDRSEFGNFVITLLYYLCNQCLSPLTLWVRTPFMRGVLDTTLCDKVYQWLATGRWFSPGSPVSSTNKTDRNDITEILLKMAWNTINLNYYAKRWRFLTFSDCPDN